MWLGFLVPGRWLSQPKPHSMLRQGPRKSRRKIEESDLALSKIHKCCHNCCHIFCHRCPMKLRISIEIPQDFSQRPGPCGAFGCGGHRGAGNHGPMASKGERNWRNGEAHGDGKKILVYVLVCMYIIVYTYIYIYVPIISYYICTYYMCTYTYTHAHTHIYVIIRIRMCIIHGYCIYTYMHMNTE